MTPTMCRVKHNPPQSYGDCLRACIASIMDLEPERVPHFADLGATGEESAPPRHLAAWAAVNAAMQDRGL